MEKRIVNWIGGEWKAAERFVEAVSPVDASLGYERAESSPLDMVTAIHAANKASLLWRKTPHEKRCALLAKVAELLSERREDLALLAAQDQGLPVTVARRDEIDRAISLFRYYSELSLPPKPTRSPLGVVGVITAWCFPLFQLARALAPALYCGNTIVVKPSSHTPQMALALAHVLADAGLPQGVVNMIFGRGAELGSLLASHPGTHALSFCGRTEVGAQVLGFAAPHIKRSLLHLSHKNSALVLEDIDGSKTIPELARSCFENSGQSPWSISRIMVIESLYEPLLEQLSKEAKLYQPCDPRLETSRAGPVRDTKQAEKAVSESVHERGRAVMGAGLSPTVIADLHNCSPWHQQELLAPVVWVVPVKAAHEGLKWINTTPYGQCASIWSGEQARAEKLASLIDVGTVWINRWNQWSPAHPDGGAKTSGLGSSGGTHALDFYSQLKCVL